MGDNIVIGFEDTVRQPVLAHDVPEVPNRVQLRRLRRQWQDRDVAGDDEIVGPVPSSLIHHEDGVDVIFNMAEIPIRCWFMALVSHHGMISAAALPWLGQTAPKI